MSLPPVYSTRLVAIHNSSGWSAGPPAGYLWVVKWVHVYAGGALPATFELFDSDSGCVWWNQLYAGVLPTLFGGEEQHVVPEGVTIEGTGTAGQQADWTLDGYLLSAP